MPRHIHGTGGAESRAAFRDTRSEIRGVIIWVRKVGRGALKMCSEHPRWVLRTVTCLCGAG
eukprot:7389398-Prymnesium_polylepis.1